jgi:hypothetical protein
MSFESISNQMWSQLRGGPTPDTGPYEESFYGKTNYEGIDFDALANFIARQRTDRSVYYRPTYEKGFSSREEHILIERQTLHSNIITPLNVPFKYISDQGENVTTKLSGLLNKRKDYVDPSWGYKIRIDPVGGKMLATLRIFYTDTKKHRTDITDTIDPNDFRIADKYIAIALSTPNLTDFCYLIKHLFGEASAESMRKDISHKFAVELSKRMDPAHLNYLYENIPEFAIEHLAKKVQYSTFEMHMDILQGYDDTGFFSWFKDSSGAMINLFRLMCSGDSSRLFTSLKDDPALIKRIYHNLDGTSTVNGQTEATYVLFANLLYALCLVNGFEGLTKKTKTYYIGKDYELDSNVQQGNDQRRNEILLRQYKKVTKSYTTTETDEFGITIGTFEHEYVDEKLAYGAYYYPLDLVKIVDMDSKDRTPLMVPAIFVKAISDKEEWKDIKKNVRIGLDVLAIIIGIASLGTASPLVFALAVVDIGLSATDIVVALNEDELMKTPEGREFLQNWNEIMIVGGIATSGPLLVQSTFRLGTKLLSKATLIETKNFLRGSLLKMIMTTNRLITTQFEIIVDLFSEFGSSAFTKNMINLYEEGIVLMKNPQQKAMEYVFVFKNEVLFATDLRGLQKEIATIFKTAGSNLTDKLHAFLLALRKTKSVVNTGAEIGEALSDLTKKWGTAKMKLMKGEFETVLKMLDEKGIKLVETSNIDDVYFMVTKIIDKKRKVIRIEKILSVHPEMRFLDLQHELDHITQFESALRGEFCTSVRFEGALQEASASKAANLGRLKNSQMEFLEFENRVREIRRLKHNDAPQQVIDKHIDGIKPYEKDYFKYKNSEKKWIDNYFPEFNPTY